MSHKGFLDTNGVLVSNNKDVTDHAKNFYASLYADKSVKIDDGFFANCPCLGDEEQERIGNGISMDELKRTLKPVRILIRVLMVFLTLSIRSTPTFCFPLFLTHGIMVCKRALLPLHIGNLALQLSLR